jgi:hypothetical protein
MAAAIEITKAKVKCLFMVSLSELSSSLINAESESDRKPIQGIFARKNQGIIAPQLLAPNHLQNIEPSMRFISQRCR